MKSEAISNNLIA